MESAAVVTIGDRSLEVVVAQALDYLTGLQYKESTRRQIAKCWKRFVRFAHQRGGNDAGIVAVGEHYLKACRRPGDKEYRRPSGQLLNGHAIRVLTEFALHGSFVVRGRIARKAALSPDYEAVLADYRRFSKQHRSNSKATLDLHERDIRRFFVYLAFRRVEAVADIDASVVSAFIASRTPAQPTSLKLTIASLRSLMRYLFMRGLVPQSLVDHVRAFRVQCPQPLPSVWRAEDVVTLLGVVDRSSPVGKRDYAILLLAAHLGLRGGDIRQLRMDHILWEQSKIELTQSKTGGALSLPMSEELGVALIDYLRNGRPTSGHREVFLRAHAPFVPMTNLGGLISKYRQLAGVRLSPPPRWRGLHSLRHSLASRLIEAGTPLEVIAEILGHKSQQSTQSYIRIDVEALRDVALKLDEVGNATA